MQTLWARVPLTGTFPGHPRAFKHAHVCACVRVWGGGPCLQTDEITGSRLSPRERVRVSPPDGQLGNSPGPRRRPREDARDPLSRGGRATRSAAVLSAHAWHSKLFTAVTFLEGGWRTLPVSGLNVKFLREAHARCQDGARARFRRGRWPSACALGGGTRSEWI